MELDMGLIEKLSAEKMQIFAAASQDVIEARQAWRDAKGSAVVSTKDKDRLFNKYVSILESYAKLSLG